MIDSTTANHWLTVPGDWRRANDRENYDILWDKSQSFGQVWPRPTASKVSEFYELDDYYTHSHQSELGKDVDGFIQKVQTKLSWLQDKGVEPDKNWWSNVIVGKGLRILEIGCGNGSNLSVFTSLGHRVVGVEPDPTALKTARDLGHLVYQGTAEALPTEVIDDHFDVVVFMHVLEHCINPLTAVENAANLLNPGGRFVAEVPNNACLGAKRFGELWYWLDVPRHLNFFTEASLRSIAAASGIRVDETHFTGYCRQFGSDWKKAQKKIAESFGLEDDARITRSAYWLYLLETTGCPNEKKYDSVRVVGTKP